MRLLDLRSVCRRRKRTRRKKLPAEYLAENVLDRDFKSKEQNEKWLTDVTEFKYGTGGKVYLCAILNLYGRNIAGFSLGRKNSISLVFEAFDQAFQMKETGIRQSMSRPGKCLDNAPMEGFWGILKSKMYYLYHFGAYDQLCDAITAYIHFYNYERYQRRLGCMTPMEFLAAGGQ